MDKEGDNLSSRYSQIASQFVNRIVDTASLLLMMKMMIRKDSYILDASLLISFCL